MKTLFAILSHQKPKSIQKMLTHWESLFNIKKNSHLYQILIIYGGTKDNFKKINFNDKVFIDDEKIKTKFHQAQKQSYTNVFKKIFDFIKIETNVTEILFLEYDFFPINEKFLAKYKKELEQKHADVLFPKLQRIDNTNHPHYLYHLADKKFAKLYNEKKVFTALIVGSYWKKSALEKFTTQNEAFPIYLEIYIPSTCHHIGIKITNFKNHKIFISHQNKNQNTKDFLAFHPKKDAWD